jgi:indolepyruvate ferredoxin oxidoreductase beta subunit
VSAAEPCRVLLVGVGGQGVLTAAGILGEAALLSGLEVSVGQLHGMSQRGGSVQATVVVGEGGSSFVEAGRADVVLGFEPLETLRARPALSERTLVIVNREPVVPFTLAQQDREYPDLEAVLAEVRGAAGRVVEVDGAELAGAVGRRSLNVALLGILVSQGALPFDADAVWRAIETRSPPRHLESNRRAFELGRERVVT